MAHHRHSRSSCSLNPDGTLTITGPADSLLKVVWASSEGFIGREAIEYRPLLSPGDLTALF